MQELIVGFLLFAVVIGGLGLSCTATLPLATAERLMAAPVAGCVAVYLFAWLHYWTGATDAALYVLPLLAAAGLLWRRRAIREVLADPASRQLLAGWVVLTGWCLGWLALIRSYSGGEWIGDWVEHYERASFFIDHRSLDTIFIHKYLLPARPPLANLVTGMFLGLGGRGFAHYQVICTLFSTLAFFPAALLARHFGRRDDAKLAVPPLLLLLMLSPVFLQNATFSWTKLPAAFFILAGLYFFLTRARPLPDFRLACAAGCLAAAILTHYSAAPYALVLAAAWLLELGSSWRSPEVWRRAWLPAMVVAALFATWFPWSIRHYGAATFLSNTAVGGGEGLTAAQQLTRRATNLLNTVVPHPIRPAEYEYIAQSSVAGWRRDYFFNLYQTNLIFAFGTAGFTILLVLWRRTRDAAKRWWLWFSIAVILLSTGAASWPDRWGVTHIGLQPLVVLGLAWIAISWRSLDRFWRIFLWAGLAVDFVAGIAIQFWMEHVLFTETFASRSGEALRLEYGYAAWNNFLAKFVLHLDFLGDKVPAPFAAIVLAGLFALALGNARRALRSPVNA
jgi:hypothetical protein